MQTIHECEELLDDADDIDDSTSVCSDSDSFHTAFCSESERKDDDPMDIPMDITMDIPMEEEEMSDAPRAEEALYRFIHDEYEEERAFNAARMKTPLEVVGINARFNNRISQSASKVVTSVGAFANKRKRARELDEDSYDCESDDDDDDDDELEEGEIREVSAYPVMKARKVFV